MMPSALVQSSKTEAYSASLMLDAVRWENFSRWTSEVHGRFASEVARARQTFQSNNEFRKEKLMAFVGVTHLEEDALKWLEVGKVQVSRPASPFWVRNLKTCQSKSVDDIANTVDSLFEFIERSGFKAVDPFLAEINVATANSIHLVAVLRALFSVRNNLENWRPLRDRTCLELDSRGRNSKAIMAGLNVD